MTMKTILNLKSNVPPVIQECIKAATKYQQQCTALAAAGAALADSVYKVGSLVNNDMGDAIRKLGESLREQETRREELARYLASDLITSLRQAAESDIRDITTFEKNYKKDRDAIFGEILKLESKTKKAGKKTSAEQLKMQIQELNDRVKEADVMRGNKLRDVVLLERKKFGNFIASWNYIVSRETDNHTSALTNFRAHESVWNSLPGTIQTAPKDVEDMIKRQERTLVQIQSDENSGRSAENLLSFGSGSGSTINNYQSYTDYDSYDPNANADQSYYQKSQGGGGGDESSQAKVLYDYAGQEAEDLPLAAEEIITIVQHDDGSGWTKGQNSSGMIGIFPTSYVEYL